MNDDNKVALTIDGLSKSSVVKNAKRYAKFFSVDVCIKVFGITILEYHFPPKTT